jgi:DNA-binding transcriptional regulator YiaG
MQYGIRKGLEDVAHELKAIKNALNSICELFTDEYISTEECARRLQVSDQTIRNWIAIGRKHPDKGWKAGVHYVNVRPEEKKKALIRVPWNRLVQSFAKNRTIQSEDFQERKPKYKREGLSEQHDKRNGTSV